MTSKAWLIIGIELILSLLVIYVLLGQVSDAKKRADDAEQSLSLAKATITDMQTRQRDVAALDAKYTKELANAQAENDRLRADVVAGKRRLQIAATCSRDETTGATGLVDGSSPRLTADAELNYWRLRDGIATVTKQLTGLQAYVREQCLK
ncbi:MULTISPECIES: lysis protein [unclassified Leclercia]|uniref:lysis protein n=1 Tax=unclassified Leclercia TaxID=2627398 RepID=UPI0025B8DBFD|nr:MULTISPECIES: lysis protein [unclassified Leclercia]